MSAPEAPPPVGARLCVGVTGHRAGRSPEHSSASETQAAVQGVIARIAEAASNFEEVRLHSMLADGADRIAADAGLAAGWTVVAALPFGAALTAAIGAAPKDADAEARRALLAQAQAAFSAAPTENGEINAFAKAHAQSRVFALAEQDQKFAADWIAAAGDARAQERFAATASERYALAARVAIEQCDLFVAVWDGVSQSLVGGTGHTVRQTLEAGTPVIWINAKTPTHIRVLRSPDDLFGTEPAQDLQSIASLIGDICQRNTRALTAPHGPAARYRRERRRRRNGLAWRGYRLVENLMGRLSARTAGKPTALRVRFASAEAQGAAEWSKASAAIAQIVGSADAWLQALQHAFNARFGWADAIATELSDAYRGGMVLNFALAALAVLVGILYGPLHAGEEWMFVAGELVLTALIMIVTMVGVLRHWHRRWLESRRVAEYLRHAYYLMPLGVSRAPGLWPRGVHNSWPEEYARAVIREVGLPQRALDAAYIKGILRDVIAPHVAEQLTYHREKAMRLHAVHRRLDRCSLLFFVTAFAIAAAEVSSHFLHWPLIPDAWSPWLSFASVALPMLGATFSGIRFFGDFERFGSISDVAAASLQDVNTRIEALADDTRALDYDTASRLAHAVQTVFVQEMESWQAIFGGKHMSVPI